MVFLVLLSQQKAYHFIQNKQIQVALVAKCGDNCGNKYHAPMVFGTIGLGDEFRTGTIYTPSSLEN